MVFWSVLVLCSYSNSFQTALLGVLGVISVHGAVQRETAFENASRIAFTI